MGLRLIRKCSLEPSMIEKIRRRASLSEAALRTMDSEERAEVSDCKKWVEKSLLFVMDGGA